MLDTNSKYLSALKSVINEDFDYSKLNNKSILVTGATGLIGKALVDYILTLSESVKVYAASRSLESFNKRFLKRDNLYYFEYDLKRAWIPIFILTISFTRQAMQTQRCLMKTLWAL